MKRMASPTSWFGLRTRSSSKRSVSPPPPCAPLSLRAATRCRSQAAALSGRRGSPAPEGDLMRTYLAWVNAHLKRRQEADKITDLAAALRDGLTLLALAEALSGREVSGAVRSPAGEEEREANVAAVLSFLLAEGLEVGSVSAREIMEGNLKHLLRVIYAMACHYKPAPSQRAAPTADRSLGSPAVSEYASLKRQVNEFERKLRGNALIDKYRRMSINSNILSDVETGAGGYDTDNTVCDSDGADLSPVDSIPQGNHSDKMEEPIYVNVHLCSDPTRDSVTADSASILRHAGGSSVYSTQDVVLSRETGVKNREVHVYSEDFTDQFSTVESCLDELATSLSDLTPIKQQIMQVQSALGSSYIAGDLFPEVSLRSQLGEARARCEEQSEQLSESAQRGERLAAELSAVVQECTDLSERLTESLSIRADVLRKDYLLQNSEAENLSLRISAREKDEIVKQLEGRLLLRQELVATLESQVGELRREKRRGRVSDPLPAGPAPPDPSETQGHLSARVKEVCEVLFALRSRVGKDPASSQMIDSVETGLYAIVERLYYYAARSLKRPKSDARGAQRGRGSSCNRPATGHKPESTDLDPSQLVVFDICQTPEGPPRQTQLLYYVDKQETPCRVGIQKPASDVKLSDVKSQINRSGSFSYHFKVEDPDFGALKEEISGDSDRVPVYKKNTVVVYLESHDV